MGRGRDWSSRIVCLLRIEMFLVQITLMHSTAFETHPCYGASGSLWVKSSKGQGFITLGEHGWPWCSQITDKKAPSIDENQFFFLFIYS